jgi:hypothetical protein
MSELVIETQNLTKRYGDVVAVDSLNLQIRGGLRDSGTQRLRQDHDDPDAIGADRAHRWLGTSARL